jgi:hypothetical protein
MPDLPKLPTSRRWLVGAFFGQFTKPIIGDLLLVLENNPHFNLGEY